LLAEAEASDKKAMQKLQGLIEKDVGFKNLKNQQHEAKDEAGRRPLKSRPAGLADSDEADVKNNIGTLSASHLLVTASNSQFR